MPPPDQFYSARWILPISGPPVQGGWIRVVGQRVVDLGMGAAPGVVHDWGDVAVLPQLVNAHTHLEFSDCSAPIGSPGMRLAEWIGAVYRARAAANPEQQSQNIIAGLTESRDAGVGLIGEIATPPCPYPTEPDLPETVSFAEVLGLSDERGDERLLRAREHLAQSDAAGVSPHAPYSTPWSLIERSVELAKRGDVPLAMHVAESPDERELISTGTGPFAEALRGMNLWRDDLFPWKAGRSFETLIDLLAQAPRALMVHGNDFQPDEIERLARYKNVTVVYCPRTHDFFRHGRHPVDQLLRAGVPVALGTDSRASNPDLNLWGEVQFLLNRRQDLEPAKVVRMATTGGGDALMRSRWGKIAKGSPAKFGCVSTEARDLGGLYADLAIRSFRPLDLFEES